MAQGDSEVSICNIGLIALGEDPVTSVFPPDNTKRASLCNARYHQARRAMLRAHPWNCAKRQAQLAAAVTPPSFTYANAYPVPADFLRMLDLPENDMAQWELMNLPGAGLSICTDEGAPLDVLYLFDLQDPTQMDALLVEAIGFQLGADLAIPLGRDKQLKQLLEQEREGRLSIARLVGSQENSPREWDEDVWLRSRR